MTVRETKNVTVALPTEAWINLKVLACRLNCPSYSATILKLIELETKEPHVIQSAHEPMG